MGKKRHGVSLIIVRLVPLRRRGCLSHSPSVLHGPDGEGPHVPNCSVNFIFVEGFRSLETHADFFVHGPIDALRGLEADFGESLSTVSGREMLIVLIANHKRRSLFIFGTHLVDHQSCETVSHSDPHFLALHGVSVDTMGKGETVHRALHTVLVLQDVVLVYRFEGGLHPVLRKYLATLKKRRQSLRCIIASFSSSFPLN